MCQACTLLAIRRATDAAKVAPFEPTLGARTRPRFGAVAEWAEELPEGPPTKARADPAPNT